ncbi:DUF551 domain-containing protein [Photorhabdus tasmaniensis]|nr:DUF551 domain-containing protein [Photorhabdus tasmaniensis]
MNWIKCSDRLPEPIKTVLIVISGRVYCGYLSMDEENGFYIPSGYIYMDLNAVGHWMELPQPPEDFDMTNKFKRINNGG